VSTPCRCNAAPHSRLAHAYPRAAATLASFVQRFCAATLMAIAMPAFAGDAAPTLLAAAADAGAAVFDVDGAPRKVAIGEAVPGVPWTLSAVRGERVVLAAQRRLDGRALTLELGVGEHVDAAKLDALEAAYAPQPRFETKISIDRSKGAKAPAAKPSTQPEKP
jgi:hypothetical protein